MVFEIKRRIGTRVFAGLSILIALLVGSIGLLTTGVLQGSSDAQPAQQSEPAPSQVGVPDSKVELGKLLFFDTRLSGDASTSCATCHVSENAWADGLPLSKGYSRGNLYFRNTPTLINATRQDFYDWDGRFANGDVSSLIRDHIAEAHFMNIDGRLLIERMRQVPEYEQAFIDLYGSEVSYGKILGAVGEFIRTLESDQSNPYVAFKSGNSDALSANAQAGLELFEGKAGCGRCHGGDLLSDGDFHALGVSANTDIFQEPLRHFTFRRYFRNFGVGEFVTMRSDPGLFALTHEDEDRGKFRTPSLLEVARTAPYMHNGMLRSLEDVVRFYNEGGGDHPNRDTLVRPLGLTDAEVASLTAFLESLGSDPVPIQEPELPEYQPRTLGEN